MKKLSLVLALVLVLTCALVACGGETENSSTPASSTASSKVESSTPAESSESSVESSEPAVESSEATDAPVESSEATDAPVESSEATDAPVESSEEPTEAPVESSEEPTEAPVESSDPEVSEPDEPTESENVALGATYDAKGYTDDEWGSNYTANLTDGVAATELTFDNNWFAFCTSQGTSGLNAPGGVGTVTFDLGKTTKITQIRVNAVFGDNVEGSGISGPAKITAYVGDAAGNFTSLGDLDLGSANGIAWAELNCAGQGQFVKLEVTLNGTFAFINEVEVYN